MTIPVSTEFFVDTRAPHQALAFLERRIAPAVLAPWMNTRIVPLMRIRALQRFRSQGDSVSGPWAPLKPATVEIRADQGYGPLPINVRSGQLRQFITQGQWQTSLVGQSAIIRFPAASPAGELGKKLRTAQEGKKAQNGFRATPPRPVIGVGAQDAAVITSALSTYIRLGQ